MMGNSVAVHSGSLATQFGSATSATTATPASRSSQRVPAPKNRDCAISNRLQ